MKIGILTFCRANNYGAALQAFALTKSVEQLGHEAELIDYICPAIEKMHAPRPLGSGVSPKVKIYNFLYNCTFAPRRRKFQEFQKPLLSKRSYSASTIAEAVGQYDMIVTGSDQVFNLSLTKGDTAFFLDFFQDGEKKTAYAASFGKYLPEWDRFYRETLSGFHACSLREGSAAELVRQRLGLDLPVSPDPVFLLDRDEWRRLLGLTEEKRAVDYILVYALIEDAALYKRARELSRETGWKTVVVTKALRPAGQADEVIRTAGPREFVSLLSGASYVITNSFHGTAFSLMFQRQFEVFPPPAAPERILDLLNAVGLSQRVRTAGETTVLEKIDFTSPSIILQQMKAEGIAWLKRALSRSNSIT